MAVAGFHDLEPLVEKIAAVVALMETFKTTLGSNAVSSAAAPESSRNGASLEAATPLPHSHVFAAPAADLLIGERVLGLTLHVMGDQTSALRHIDHMLDHYVAPPDGSHLVRYSYDQKVAARADCFFSVM